MDRKPRVLYVTRLNKGSTSFGYLEGFRNLGLTVQEVDTSEWLGNWALSLQEKIARKLRRGRLSITAVQAMNQAIIDTAEEFKPELIFFVGAPYILPGTLLQTQRYGLNFCHFQDDMFNPTCQTYTFFDCLPYWDYVFTTKSFNVEEFKAAGVSNVKFVWKAYTPSLHRPILPDAEEVKRYAGDVVFVGNFNYPSRADFLAEIIHQCPGVKFNIWGLGWEKLKRPSYWLKVHRWRTWPNLLKATHSYPLFFDEMSKAMNSHKIVFGMLNHNNRDLHTHRSVEIPACGGFMLIERTSEHLELFKEGVEAEYYGSFAEAFQKIQYYLVHDEERKAIAQAGHKRCMNSDYSYYDRAKTALEQYQTLMRAKE